MTGRTSATDRAARGLGIAAVASVAVVSGWLSYWHIVSVVTRHGEPGVSGHLFPVVIDGTLLAASAVLTDHARRGTRSPRWAWSAAITGTTATFWFNVFYGVPQGWLSAVIAALVSAMLLLCVELLVALLHGAVADTTIPGITSITESAVQTAISQSDAEVPVINTEVPDADTQERTVKVPDRRPVTKGRRARVIPDAAADIFRSQPDISGAELARRLDIEPRTAQRWIGRLRAGQEPVQGMLAA